MAEVTVEQLHKIMDKAENIRNWIIISAEEHGRTALANPQATIPSWSLPAPLRADRAGVCVFDAVPRSRDQRRTQ